MTKAPLTIAPMGGAPVLVGVDVDGGLPGADLDRFDVLITTAASPSAPWVGVAGGDLSRVLSAMEQTAGSNPVAAGVLAHVLRIGAGLDFEAALTLESLAYSTLLGGDGFRRWRAGSPARARPPSAGPLVTLTRDGDDLAITLARPEARNALCAALRDELTEALTLAVLDPSTRVTLRGDGPVFCAGGDLDEFGQATDLAAAHVTRMTHSPARLAAAVGPRLTVMVQGAAIGGGIEIAAAAGRIVADPGAVFRLPEVGMGLIPGAGGTVTLPRRIGRHRTAFMALSGLDIDARQALTWGLVDRLEPVP